MSEFFVSQGPQAVCEAARCLLAVLALRPVARVEASVRLRLGLLLSEHTSCALEAKEQLEKSVSGTGDSDSSSRRWCVSWCRCWWQERQETCWR